MNFFHKKSVENQTQVAANHKTGSNSAIKLIDNRPVSVLQLRNSNGKVTQLCQHNHPEHAAIPVCPYGLKDAAFRIPPKHVKGAKKSKFSEGSQDVMNHAHAQLSAGRATVESTNTNGGNDIEVSVERAHRHNPERPRRRFNIHKGSNVTESGVMAHDFFLKDGQSSESESSDSEDEAPVALAEEFKEKGK